MFPVCLDNEDDEEHEDFLDEEEEEEAAAPEQQNHDSSSDDESSYFRDPSNLPSPKSASRKYSWASSTETPLVPNHSQSE